MKGEKDALWEPLKHVGSPTAKIEGDMGAREEGGKGTIGVGGPTEVDELAAKPPKTIGHDAAKPTLEDMAGGDVRSTKSESAKAGAYAGEMGGSAKGSKEKFVESMAQRVGKPRKGY